MLHSALFRYLKGINVLSTGQVMRILGITRATVNAWIAKGKIHCNRIPVGDRTFLGFEPEEIQAIKKKMVKKRHHGKSLMKA